MMTNNNKTLNLNISSYLEVILDQLESVTIFDNKNCENNLKIQENEGKSDSIPHD